MCRFKENTIAFLTFELELTSFHTVRFFHEPNALPHITSVMVATNFHVPIELKDQLSLFSFKIFIEKFKAYIGSLQKSRFSYL